MPRASSVREPASAGRGIPDVAADVGTCELVRISESVSKDPRVGSSRRDVFRGRRPGRPVPAGDPIAGSDPRAGSDPIAGSGGGHKASDEDAEHLLLRKMLITQSCDVT